MIFPVNIVYTLFCNSMIFANAWISSFSCSVVIALYGSIFAALTTSAHRESKTLSPAHGLLSGFGISNIFLIWVSVTLEFCFMKSFMVCFAPSMSLIPNLDLKAPIVSALSSVVFPATVSFDFFKTSVMCFSILSILPNTAM